MAGFIDQSQSGQEYVHRETEQERIAREARYVRSEQARIRKAIDDEWLAKGVLLSKHNKFKRDREFTERWEQHPIAQAWRKVQEAEWTKRASEAEKRAEKTRQSKERERISPRKIDGAEAEQHARRLSSRIRASIAEWTRAGREEAEAMRLRRSAKRTLDEAFGRERRQAEERVRATEAEARRRAEAEEQRLVKAVAGWKRQQTPLDRDTRGYVRRSVSGGSGSFGFGRTESYLETLKSAAVPLLVSAAIFAFAFFVHRHG